MGERGGEGKGGKWGPREGKGRGKGPEGNEDPRGEKSALRGRETMGRGGEKVLRGRRLRG